MNKSPEQNDSSFKTRPELFENSVGIPGGEGTNLKANRPRNLKRFQPSFTEELDELDCPFPGYIGLFKWKLGTNATVKSCTNEKTLKYGIKYYIVFEDDNGTKRKLGTTCSIVAKEWVEMLQFVLESNQETKKVP